VRSTAKPRRFRSCITKSTAKDQHGLKVHNGTHGKTTSDQANIHSVEPHMDGYRTRKVCIDGLIRSCGFSFAESAVYPGYKSGLTEKIAERPIWVQYGWIKTIHSSLWSEWAVESKKCKIKMYNECFAVSTTVTSSPSWSSEPFGTYVYTSR
jgi:hypothetical protein